MQQLLYLLLQGLDLRVERIDLALLAGFVAGHCRAQAVDLCLQVGLSIGRIRRRGTQIVKLRGKLADRSIQGLLVRLELGVELGGFLGESRIQLRRQCIEISLGNIRAGRDGPRRIGQQRINLGLGIVGQGLDGTDGLIKARHIGGQIRELRV